MTQKEQLANALRSIKLDVSAQDKAEYLEKANINSATLSHYLNGRGWDLDVGTKMLEFFSQKQQERSRIINASVKPKTVENEPRH